MARRVLTVLLVTTALLVAGPIVARTLATASPTADAAASAGLVPVANLPARANPGRGWYVESLPDEAAMALIGTALLAAGTAIRKAA